MTDRYTVTLDAESHATPCRLGSKFASLLALARVGAPVQPGFVVTVDAFEALLADSRLRESIDAILHDLDLGDLAKMAAGSAEIRRLVHEHPIPPEVVEAVTDAYGSLCESPRLEVPVAVRSSAAAEDLPDASFAGQYDTCLWIRGPEAVLRAVRHCWSSLWTVRALAYRAANALGEERLAMAVGVQQMVDARAAGVAMTVNPSNGDCSKIVIEAVGGLGEPVTSGEVIPDHWVVDKVLLIPVRATVAPMPRELGVSQAADGRGWLRQAVDGARRQVPCLGADEVIEVARLAKEAERYRGQPQEIEWAIARDLPTAVGLRLLQSRAETVWSRKPRRPSGCNGDSGAAGIASTLLGR
ncbi:PEP/pyruvate-binding domain-containing protein [Streptomyces sioyaensis]|uniref:PEP/pyruvate-binding domain-containing protein n=1 Tax=Streptomyces sioyaensis TaxID=67364 RepID=UPI003D712596